MEFLATTRKISADGTHFTTEYGGQTHFVRMPHANSSAVNSTIVDSAKWAKQVFAEGGSRDVLIVVHGYNVKQNAFMQDVSILRKRLKKKNFKGAVVGFGWPSEGWALAYDKDRADATRSAPHLTDDIIPALLNYRSDARIHILAHSMGTRVVSEAFEHADGQASGNDVAQAISQVAFTAAEVPQDWTAPDGKYLRLLRRFSDRFTLYWSKHDEVLHIAEDQFGEKAIRLGRAGLLGSQQNQLEHVDCTAYYRQNIWSPWFPHSHNWYYNPKYDEFLTDLTQLLKRHSGTFQNRVAGTNGVYAMKP